ncbi:MAG: hypothetical protein HY709_00820 [Candidatus Latescibacteria bacterium]|nr:hypothetical protein [Candidatus Latescibacterota bacterium]
MPKRSVLGQDPLNWIRKTDEESIVEEARDAESLVRYESENRLLAEQLESAKEQHQREAEELRTEIERLRGQVDQAGGGAVVGAVEDETLRETLTKVMRAYLDMKQQLERRDQEHFEKVAAIVQVLKRYKERCEDVEDENQVLREQLQEIDGEREKLLKLCALLREKVVAKGL